LRRPGKGTEKRRIYQKNNKKGGSRRRLTRGEKHKLLSGIIIIEIISFWCLYVWISGTESELLAVVSRRIPANTWE
jgi:hypothetical protein